MKRAQKIILVVILGVLSIFLQGTFLRSLLPSPYVPNIVIVIVVFLAFHEVSYLGVVLAFILGLLLDLSSATLLGPWAGAFTALFAILGSLSRRVFVESYEACFILMIPVALGTNFAFLSLAYRFQPGLIGNFIPLIINSLCTAVVGPLVYFFLSRVFNCNHSPYSKGLS